MRILVVEDDRLLNNTLCYNLEAAGYVVDSALTKSAASDFLTKQDYDLIVLDVNLPDGNGFDFCREVKERRPDTAVIFLTANDMESDMLKGYELGAEDYVTKPFPMSVFQKKLSVVLGLEDKLNNMPNNLSGGQQQRVAIARALVSKPAIVLADEPTGNLDSKTSADVLGLLKTTSQKFHQTLVMITHNSEIAQLADRIIRIEDGKIVQ